MFAFIKNTTKSNINTIINAIKAYPLISIVSILYTFIVLIVIVNKVLMTDIYLLNGLEITRFAFIAFLLSLAVECVVGLVFAKRSKRIIVNISFVAFAILAVTLYMFLNNKHANAYYDTLCLIFVLVFIAMNVEKSYESVFNISFHALLFMLFVILYSFCVFIIYKICDFLFTLNDDIFALFVVGNIVIVAEIGFLVFLGNFKKPISNNTAINIFLFLLVALAISCLALLFAYNMQTSIEANNAQYYLLSDFVLWYSFFLLFILWICKAKKPIKYWNFALGALCFLNTTVFFAIIIRINQYGITIEQYYTFIGCMALMAMIIFSAFFKNPPFKSMILLICLIAISSFDWIANAKNFSNYLQEKQMQQVSQNTPSPPPPPLPKKEITHFENSNPKSFLLDSQYKWLFEIKHSTNGLTNWLDEDYYYYVGNDEFIISSLYPDKNLLKIEQWNKFLCQLQEDKNTTVKLPNATLIFDYANCYNNYEEEERKVNHFSVIVLIK